MKELEKVRLRRLCDNIDDYILLEKWYQQKEVYMYFEQRQLNFEEIKNKYYPRTLDDSSVPVYMIEFDNEPIGIVQYKLIDEESKKLYKIDDDNCYEIDIFIGELDYHGKGIGRTSINIIEDYLFNEENASLLVMCPLKDNVSAIKCYLKCGFVIKDNFFDTDTVGNVQEFVLMVKYKNM